MEPENQSGVPDAPLANTTQAGETTTDATEALLPANALPPEPGTAVWVFIGNQGLRAGWSVIIFLALAFLFVIPMGLLGSLIADRVLHLQRGVYTPVTGILQELVVLLPVLAAAAVMALIERRRFLDYNLTGPRSERRFIEGIVAGFAGLSVLVGALAAGGWLHIGPGALTGMQIFDNALMWGVCFLLVGLFEEGTFRCYLQYTLTRGINLWWALAIEAALCLDIFLRSKGNGVWGVYGLALLGLVPCLILGLRKTEGASFWLAAWVTSTVFGFIHTGNNGENWIGIFAAGAIGFVFCVSIRVTGSAWWAIGCHMGWDWAETYFYGTADSGMVAKGHYLTATPSGPALWSGGADGPEGSLLVLGAILLLLIAVLAIYGRKRTAPLAKAIEQQTA